MKCEFYGTEYPYYANFCGKCGKILDSNHLVTIINYLKIFLISIKEKVLISIQNVFSAKQGNKCFTEYLRIKDYSIDKQKTIIPVSYINISSFLKSIATNRDRDDYVAHYDIKGNKLK